MKAVLLDIDGGGCEVWVAGEVAATFLGENARMFAATWANGNDYAVDSVTEAAR